MYMYPSTRMSRGEWGPSQPPRISPTLKKSEAKSKAIVEGGPASKQV
jgi:hypothetical protein